jgi:plastocyanin
MKRFSLSALVALGILFPVTFLPAQGNDTPKPGPGPEVPAQQVDTIVIQIVADADSVVAVPNVVTVSPGQVVTWNSDLGDWTVFFQSAQPFGEQAVGQGIRGGRGQQNGQAVRNEAAEGRYKYDILVQVQGGRNLRADPEIVIAPRELP